MLAGLYFFCGFIVSAYAYYKKFGGFDSRLTFEEALICPFLGFVITVFWPVFLPFLLSVK